MAHSGKTMTFATDIVPQEKNTYNLGTENLKWIIRGNLPLSDVTGADDLKAIEAISGTSGLLKKTAANTWALDTNNYVTSSGITSVTIGATSPVQSSTSTAQTGSSASTTISLKDAYGDTKNPYGSKTKNYVLAAPSNANGAPSFRALIAADIPDLSGTYVKKITSTDNAIVRFDGTSGAIQNSGIIINDNNHLIAPSIRIANTYYGISFGRTTNTPVETILHTGIKWVSSSHMPVIHITGYAYGLQSPVEFKIGFYIYGNKIGWSGATNMGSWEPDIYLFKDTRNGTDYVAVGLAGSCYFLQLSVDLQDEMGKFNSVVSTDWSWDFLTTTGTIPSADDGTTCVKVSYKASIFGAKYANITTTSNAIAYYTNTTGTFGSKASANGALYATSANGALQWGTLPIAQGGTGKTNAADAWTALGGGASGKHADSYFALASHNHAASDINSGTFDVARIPNLSWSKITSDKPTTLSGYGITDAKIASGVITLGSNTITPVTSVNGHNGSSVSVTASDLGLASALKYVGTKSSLPTATDSTTYSTYNNGDVITVSSKEYAYVKGSNAAGSSWVELGDEGSYKLKQTAFTNSTGTADSTNTSTTFIYSFSQDENGTITNIKTRSLPTATNSVAGITKVGASGGAAAYSHTHSYLANTNTGAADRPIYITGNAAAQTTYRMAGTNVAATTGITYSGDLDTGIWYVNGISGTDKTTLYNQSDGVIIANKYSNSWISEIYQDYRTGQLAIRGKNNGTWAAWRNVLDSTNYTTYTVQKDGTGASGTWGISITGNAANVTDTVAIDHGGTGATSAAAARANLGTWSLVSDSYNTLMPADGTTNAWVKIGKANTSYGLLPSQSGGAGSGHNYIGTSSWYWKYAYIDEIYGHLNGNADTATGISKTGGSTANFWRGDNNWSSTLTGSLTISKAGECGLEVINSQATNPHKGFFGGGSSGNLGIYDRTYNKWIVYSDPSGNVTLNGNANTATSAGKWTTARTLTIGNKGQSVDGSGNVTWSLADIGAAPASTVSCTTANVQSALGINTSSGSTSKALTEKGTWATFGTSNLTIGTTSTTAMAGNTTVTNVAISADTTTNKNYALVFGTTPSDGTSPTAAKTESLQKNSAKFYVNPSTGNIQATTFNGYTLAAASAKGVVTTIDTSANLPTSSAVKTFVEGKGYVTSSGVTSVATGAGLTGGTITGTGTIKAKLKSETAHTADSATPTNTASRQYAVGVDKSGYLSVNVPWTDNDTHRVIKVNGTQALASNTTALNLIAGSNVSITDGGSGSVTIAATDTKYNAATTSTAGLMSAADKTKLNGIDIRYTENSTAPSNPITGTIWLQKKPTSSANGGNMPNAMFQTVSITIPYNTATYTYSNSWITNETAIVATNLAQIGFRDTYITWTIQTGQIVFSLGSAISRNITFQVAMIK